MVNTVLCPLNGTDGAKPVLRAAFSLSRELGCHLEVLHVRPDPKESIPLLGEGMSVAMVEDMIEMAETEASGRARRARQMFDDQLVEIPLQQTDVPKPGVDASVSWNEETGREDEAVSARGRLNDLVIVRRPGDRGDVMASMTLNAAVFESGRPVLVVPPNGFDGVGDCVAISWNGSPQAARAVSAAVPLLERANRVVVLTADSPRTSAARAGELAAYLAWHGIEPETRTFKTKAPNVAPMLLEECAAVSANMLVMGAYTHSRMRQLILGGVTKHVLNNAEIPLFMAH